jgi:hypothetical protein
MIVGKVDAEEIGERLDRADRAGGDRALERQR